MIKKLSLLFFICILSALNINATVYSGSCGSDVRYSLDTETGLLSITGTGAMTNYIYSSAPWYSNMSYIKTVEISNGVTSIGEFAFYWCSALTSVTIPNSVTSIGNYAFYKCSGLTSVTIDNSVTSIGKEAFYGCSRLTSITIPNSVTSIGYNAFEDCSGLTSVHITDIAAWCRISFYNAYSNPLYYANHLFMDGKEITDLVIPNSVTSIGNYAFYWCSGLTSVTIDNSVTSIGERAFYNCSALTSVTIPNSVTSIGSGAFNGCTGLTSIEIPNSVTSIGEYAFGGCSGLTSVHITDIAAWCKISFGNYLSNPLYYAHHLFMDGKEITDLVIPNSVTSIGNYAFYWCSGLTSVTIDNSVTSIGKEAFYGCSGLTEVYCDAENVPMTETTAFQDANISKATLIVPEASVSAYKATSPWSGFGTIKYNGIYSGSCGTNVKYSLDTSTGLLSITGTGAMNDYSYYSSAPWNSHKEYVKTVEIANSVTSIGEYAFYECSGLTSVTIPNSVTSIGFVAFCNCSSLTSVTIPNSVTSIGVQAFYECSGLTSITIPNSVTSIGRSAFNGCSGLTSISVENGNEEYDSRDNCNAIIETASNTLIAGCKNTTIPNSVTSIGNYAFEYCYGLTSVTIPNSVTSIGSGAFYKCSGLTSVTIPNSVTSIGSYAFEYCYGLTSVTIPNSMTSIGYSAFYKCSGLTSVHITDIAAWCKIVFSDYDSNPLRYAKHLFMDGKEIIDLVIPNSVTSIGNHAFRDCSGLTSVTIPNSVTSIGNHAFSGCSGLTSITIPNSVTNIGNYAFYYCSGLTSVTIDNSVTSIGVSAFYECSSLKKLKVDKTTPINITSSIISTSSDAVLYVPKGSKSSYASANIWKNFKTIKEFPDGDVNWDSKTDVVDVVDIARFVVGTPRDAFDDFLADMNGSGSINVADAVVLVNEIAGDTQFARGLFREPQHDDDVLSLSYNNDARLSMQLEGTERYTAFQFDLWLPSDMNMTDLSLNKLRSQGHQLLYNKVEDGHYRVVVLSTSRETFNGTSGELLSMMLDGFASDDIWIDNIHFVTNQGYDVPFDALNARYAGTVTDIQSVEPASVEKQAIYNLSGQRLMSPRKGLNIVDGKKIIVK